MSEGMNMSVSGIMTREGKKCISVLFTQGTRSAEGTVPDAKIHTNKGFSDKEIQALEEYMRQEQKSIVKMAKSVNVMKAFMDQ